MWDSALNLYRLPTERRTAMTPLMAAREYIVGQMNCGEDKVSLKTADKLIEIYSDSQQEMPEIKEDASVGNKEKF